MQTSPLFQVDGRPFFVLGAQCGTNNTYFREDLADYWRSSEALQINTAELHAYWELLEPEEGVFDYAQVDMLLDECRRHGVRLLLIWFGSWKNATLKYAPRWVKEDRQRFWRVTDALGGELPVLSPHCEETQQADTRALLRLVEHLKEVDAGKRTVIGIQGQNECGILGGARRDHHAEVSEAFRAAVPAGLIDYVAGRAGSPVHQTWAANGSRRSGTWEEVFGRDGEEFFSALAFARFINSEVAQAKQLYDLPMYANVWMAEQELERPGIEYPCGGPVTKVLDIWRWGAPALDLIAPDVYSMVYSQFDRDCANYARDDNPLYIPEAVSRTSTRWAPFVAAGHDCLGFSIMGKMYNMVREDGTFGDDRAGMVYAFRDLRAIAPLLPQYRGTGRIYPVVQEESMGSRLIRVAGWDILVTFHPFDAYNAPAPAGPSPMDRGAGLIIQAGENEFYAVGTNLTLAPFRSQPADEIWPDWAHAMSTDRLVNRTIGYLLVEEGYFEDDGQFTVTNRRNGDSTDSGLVLMIKTRVIHFVMDPNI